MERPKKIDGFAGRRTTRHPATPLVRLGVEVCLLAGSSSRSRWKNRDQPRLSETSSSKGHCFIEFSPEKTAKTRASSTARSWRAGARLTLLPRTGKKPGASFRQHPSPDRSYAPPTDRFAGRRTGNGVTSPLLRLGSGNPDPLLAPLQPPSRDGGGDQTSTEQDPQRVATSCRTFSGKTITTGAIPWPTMLTVLGLTPDIGRHRTRTLDPEDPGSFP